MSDMSRRETKQNCKEAKQGMYEDLEAFLKISPNNGDFNGNEDIVKARFACSLAKKNFNKVYKLISASP